MTDQSEHGPPSGLLVSMASVAFVLAVCTAPQIFNAAMNHGQSRTPAGATVSRENYSPSAHGTPAGYSECGTTLTLPMRSLVIFRLPVAGTRYSVLVIETDSPNPRAAVPTAKQ